MILAGVRNKMVRALEQEGFKLFDPAEVKPDRFIERARKAIIRRIVRAAHRLSPPDAIRAIQSLDPEQRDVQLLINFLCTRYLGLLRPAQVRSEITEFANIVKDLKPKTVLEIGTATGGTLFLYSRLADPEATVVSVDLPGGIYGGGYPAWKIPLYKSFSLPRQKMHLVRADSHSQETFEKVNAIFAGKGVDFLFIDADHTYEGVKRDFELYSPLVKDGGMIAFHDIVTHPQRYGCGVDIFWNQIKKPGSRELIEDRKQGWAGIGIL